MNRWTAPVICAVAAAAVIAVIAISVFAVRQPRDKEQQCRERGGVIIPSNRDVACVKDGVTIDIWPAAR